MSEYKIVKVGGAPPPPPRTAPSQTSKKHHHKQPKFGVLKGGKTARNKPRFEPVRDPAKPPPMRKATLRILTETGAEKRRQRIKKTVRSMPEQKVRHMLRAAGLPADKAPLPLAREILEGGMEAGMIVAK